MPGDPPVGGPRAGVRRRILHIGNEQPATRAGGMNRYVAELVRAQHADGMDPTVLVVGDGTGAGDTTTVAVVGADAPLGDRVLRFRRAAARLARSVDVVDVHFALYSLLPLRTTGLRRLPLVVHFQGPWADESRIGRSEGRIIVAVKRAVERAVYRRGDVVVVLSQAFGRMVVERYGVEPARVEVIPPGVDLVRFHPGDRAVIRRSLGVQGSSFVAVSVRRLDRRMGLDVLLDAWATVQREVPGSVLLIAGTGPERPALDALRRRLPDPDGVRLLGRVGEDALVSLYQAADCSVVPTRALEGFGLVTLESLACGTPVIVTDVAGLPEGVIGLDPSLVVPGEDPAALADRILAAAAGTLPPRDACRGHAERFTWDITAARHAALYARVAVRTRRRPRPRVAYIGHTATTSGAELALARLLPALRGRGVDPVVVLAEDGPLAERLRDAGVAVEVLAMDDGAKRLHRDSVHPARIPIGALVATTRYTWRLRNRLRALGVDIVHTNTLKSALYGGLAGRLAGIPTVWHLRDRIAPDYLPVPAVVLVRAAARVLPSAVIANSHCTLATLRRNPGRRAGVSADVVVPSAATIRPAPAGARPAGRPFTVVMVGRLAPWKGQDVFLRAFARAFPRGDEQARVVGGALFGEEAWERELRALTDQLGLAARVRFTGHVDDVAAHLASADAVVHASVVPEPFGQVVVEAMAAGVPVVAADAGGPAEVVTDGVDGLLSPVGDVAALAARLRLLARDGELRARLAGAGRERAADFAPAAVAGQIVEVYERLARRRRW